MMNEIQKLKKVSSTPQKTILRHPDGHELHIQHSTIPPMEAQKLMNHPAHFDDGGQVQSQAPQGRQTQQSFDTSAPQNMSVDPSAQVVPVPIPVQAPNPNLEAYNQLKNQYVQDKVARDSMSKTSMGLSADDPQLNQDAAVYATNTLSQQKDSEAAQKNMQQDALVAKAKQLQDTNAQNIKLGLPTQALPQEMQDALSQQIQNPAVQGNIQPASNPQGGQQNFDPTGSQDYYDMMKNGIMGQQAGILGEAQAMQKAGTQEAGIENQAAGQVQNNITDAKQKYDDLDTARQAFQEDVQNGHIDPDNYIKNMKTGSKIATGLGLILGGVAGGVLHQANPAMTFLQNNIDNDVKAQAADLGKRENLLSSNLKQFGNLRDATDMTRVMTADLMAHKLRAVAAQNQGSIASARALGAASSLLTQYAPVMSQLKARAAILGGGMGGGINPASNNAGNPQSRISQLNPRTAIDLLMTDPKEKEQATKELAQAQELDKLKNGMDAASQQLRGKFLAGSLTPGDRNSFRNTYGGILAKLGEGRFNLEESKQQMDAFLPAAGDTQNTLNDKDKNRNIFINALRTTPTLDRWGIGSGIATKYDNQGQRKLQLAPVQRQ